MKRVARMMRINAQFLKGCGQFAQAHIGVMISLVEGDDIFVVAAAEK